MIFNVVAVWKWKMGVPSSNQRIESAMNCMFAHQISLLSNYYLNKFIEAMMIRFIVCFYFMSINCIEYSKTDFSILILCA